MDLITQKNLVNGYKHQANCSSSLPSTTPSNHASVQPPSQSPPYRMLSIEKNTTDCETKQQREDWLDVRPSSSSTELEEKQWTKMWRVHVPSKIRTFLWRLAKHSLPTGDVLAHRKMSDKSLCNICGVEDSWRHSMLECPMARCVWALVDEHITEHLCATVEPSAKQWIFSLMDSLKKDDFVRVSVMLWVIWHTRRKAIHENTFQSPLSTFSFVESFIRDISHSAPATREPKTQQHVLKWIALPASSFKVNVDAAVAKSSNQGAFSAVVRDESGVFQGASAVAILGITDLAILEALACREALILASDMGLQRVMVGSDCMEVVNAINGKYLGVYGHVILKIQSLMKRFRVAGFRHESRRANGDAHNLARGATSLEVGRHVWFTQPPNSFCISSVVESYL